MVGAMYMYRSAAFLSPDKGERMCFFGVFISRAWVSHIFTINILLRWNIHRNKCTTRTVKKVYSYILKVLSEEAFDIQRLSILICLFHFSMLIEPYNKYNCIVYIRSIPCLALEIVLIYRCYEHVKEPGCFWNRSILQNNKMTTIYFRRRCPINQWVTINKRIHKYPLLN